MALKYDTAKKANFLQSVVGSSNRREGYMDTFKRESIVFGASAKANSPLQVNGFINFLSQAKAQIIELSKTYRGDVIFELKGEIKKGPSSSESFKITDGLPEVEDE